MNRVRIVGIAAMLLLAIVACGDTVTLGDRLLGTWALASFEDRGIVGVTTGSWTFSESAVFSALGTITYPGEPTDSLDVVGTWREYSESAIELTVAGDVSVWSVALSGDTAVMAYTDADGTVRITLAKPGASN